MGKWRELGAFAVLVASLLFLWFQKSGSGKIGPWGTYRPNVYFGVKRRAADSPLFGLAWLDPDGEWWENIRHDAEERDGLSRYGFLEHTGEKYGSQEIVDAAGGLFLRTSFVRTDHDRWVARISGLALDPKAPPRNASLLWYVALQSDQDSFGFPKDLSADGISGDMNVLVTAGGKDYRVSMPRNPANIHPTVAYSKTNKVHMTKNTYLAMDIQENVWDAKKIVKQALMNDATRIFQEWQANNKNKKNGPNKIVARLPNVADVAGNFFVVQQIFTLPFTFDIVFQPNEDWQADFVTSEAISGLLLDESKSFKERFDRTFRLAERGFNASQRSFAQAALSNLLGGIGHFYGKTLVQYAGKEEQEVGPLELFTAVPSRSFFPRGFLWDEGFHELLISQWDPVLSRDILKHWFALVDADGWIQREVIAGEEARRRVPREFQTQRPHIANPPTLFLAVNALMQQKDANITELKEFLHTIHPAVQRYVGWFVRTQASKAAGEWTDPNQARTFRWAGRTQGHCLASGLDDYPRAVWLTEQEGHVDLHSWLVLVTRSAGDIAQFLGYHTEAERMYAHSKRILEALDDMHWNEKTQTYCDYAYRNSTRHWVCHDGYISLFPFALQLLSPSAPQLKASLELLGDPSKLWSDYGLLSLSKQNKFFGKEENYWRGNIWLNLNFLALRALHFYGNQPGPYKEMSAQLESRLRANLINNLHLRYNLQGFLFEQYSWQDGKGLRTHPFTGWTATAAVLAMSEAPLL